MGIAAIIGAVVSAVLTGIQTSIKTGKAIREAIADSLEEASAAVRAGKLIPNEALARAREDLELVSDLRNKFKD